MNAPDAPAADIDRYWAELVTAALLGTDRREPPTPPTGDVADVVADAVRPDAASRMLVAVAGVAAVRRAAFLPRPAVTTLQPPGDGQRPWCSTVAAATWREITTEWPVLEDEWVVSVIEQGWAVPPDVLVELLLRHRSDSTRRARSMVAAGPAAAWVTDHVPQLAAASGGTVSAEAVVTVPELPVPPELTDLLVADAHTVSQRLGVGFSDRGFGAAHRAVLTNLLARCRPAVLLDAAHTLERTGVGLALALADLARLRHRMLVELGVAI